MRVPGKIIWLAALLAALLSSAAAEAEPRIALVIGNSAYGDEIGNLANPANDARLMAKTLRGIGFDVVEVDNADQNAMKRAIVDFGNKLSDAGTEATGLFYYAGHGLQVQGDNYLIPVHAQIRRESDVDVEAVPADLVLRQMDFAGSAVNIVILDACRNNPLNRSFRSSVRGLAEITRKPRGSFIAYSTAPGEVAADGSGAANSPYAKALSETIAQPGLGIEEIFRDVRGKVLAATGNKQTPWDSSSLTAPFYFQAPPPQAAAQSLSPAVDSMDPKRIELAFWESIKDSRSPDDFQAYLAKYPKGDFAPLAEIRLKNLGSTAVAAAAPSSGTAIRNLPQGMDEATAKQFERAFWDSIKDSTSPDDFEAYLKKYPHGDFAEAARGRLNPPVPAPATHAAVTPAAPAVQPAPPPMPAFEAIEQTLYARDRVNLRAAPDRGAQVLTRAMANAPLKANGRSADGAWWRVTLDGGQTAYVAASVVSLQPPASPPPAVSAAVTPPQASPETNETTIQLPVDPPAAAATPGTGNDEDVCPSDSGSAAADREAACRRLVDAGYKNTKDQVWALDNLGNALFDLNRLDEALEQYRAAVALDAEDAAGHANIGIVLVNQGRYAEARAPLDKALELQPDDPNTLYTRSQALANTGDFSGARADIKHAIERKSDDSSYFSQLGYVDLGLGDLTAAVEALDHARAMDQRFWDGTAVIAYYLAGAFDKSQTIITKGRKGVPDYPYWAVWQGLIQKAQGNKTLAQATLTAGLNHLGMSKWPGPLLAFMAGKISEDKLQELSEAGDLKTRTERQCETAFYKGELAFIAGNKAAARAYMEAARSAGVYHYLEHVAATVRLAQIGQ